MTRGTNKRFQILVTNLADPPVPTDPDSCVVRLEKVGSYTYDSPTEWHTCTKVGGTGEWGADIYLDPSWTLGDWIARFRWWIGGVEDGEEFQFTMKREDKPFDHSASVVV